MLELKNIGKKVSRLRNGYGLSINALSRVSGVSSRTIGRLEGLKSTGTSYIPKMDTVHQIAETFGMTTGTFLNTKVKEVFHASPGIAM